MGVGHWEWFLCWGLKIEMECSSHSGFTTNTPTDWVLSSRNWSSHCSRGRKTQLKGFWWIFSVYNHFILSLQISMREGWGRWGEEEGKGKRKREERRQGKGVGKGKGREWREGSMLFPLLNPSKLNPNPLWLHWTAVTFLKAPSPNTVPAGG